MEERATAKSHEILFFNTLAFTVCFAAWMLNGVLITFLSSNQVFDWGPVELGWLMGVPVLTGSANPSLCWTDETGVALWSHESRLGQALHQPDPRLPLPPPNVAQPG